MNITISLAGLVLGITGAFVSAYFFGGRIWRDNTDAEKEAHRQTKEFLSARDATIIEMRREMDGMSERLQRTDEQLTAAHTMMADIGGTNVVEMLIQNRQESRAETAALVALIGDVSIQIADHLNGKE